MIDLRHDKILVTREFVEGAHPAVVQRNFRTLTIDGKKFRIVRRYVSRHCDYYCESHEYIERKSCLRRCTIDLCYGHDRPNS